MIPFTGLLPKLEINIGVKKFIRAKICKYK